MRRSDILEAKDVRQLLRQAVANAGGRSAWAKKAGVHRTIINKFLRGRKQPTKSIIRALQLRVVYLAKKSTLSSS